jgi:hypothetical protein
LDEVDPASLLVVVHEDDGILAPCPLHAAQCTKPLPRWPGSEPRSCR